MTPGEEIVKQAKAQRELVDAILQAIAATAKQCEGLPTNHPAAHLVVARSLTDLAARVLADGDANLDTAMRDAHQYAVAGMNVQAALLKTMSSNFEAMSAEMVRVANEAIANAALHVAPNNPVH